MLLKKNIPKSISNNKINLELIFLGLIVFTLILICGYPLILFLYKTFFPTGSLELNNFKEVLNSSTTFISIRNTLLIGFATVLISTLIALPLSYLLSRTDLKNKKLWKTLFSLPYCIPPYVGAVSWIYLANPSNGLLNDLTGLKIFNVYSFIGLVWVLSCFAYTYIFLALNSAFDNMDSSMEEAARLCGATPFRVFREINLPLIFPSLLSGMILVFLSTIASFGVPAMIGTPAQIYLMTTKIYTLQKIGSLNGIYLAGNLAFLLLTISMFFIYLNKLIFKEKSYNLVFGKIAKASELKLNNKKYLVTFLLFTVYFVIFILPLLGIIISAFTEIQGDLSLNNWSLINFHKIFFEVSETPRAFQNSFLLATFTATITTLFGLFLGYIVTKTKFKTNKLVEFLVSLTYSTPGSVLAFAFIMAFGGKIFGLNFSLYNTLSLMMLAYIAKDLNVSLRTLKDGYNQIDKSLIEAAKISGADWKLIFTTMWIPMLKSSIIASWFLVFMPAFSELTMTVLLTAPNLETVGSLLFQLKEYSDAGGGTASVLSLIVMVVIIMLNFIIKFISKGKYGL